MDRKEVESLLDKKFHLLSEMVNKKIEDRLNALVNKVLEELKKSEMKRPPFLVYLIVGSLLSLVLYLLGVHLN